MSTFLIDYENTSHHGLSGFRHLAPSDTVVVFLGATNATSTMPLGVVRELTAMGDRPRLLWKRSKKSSKNYLDFQLVSYLGYLIGSDIDENQYVIVSKDSGFEAAVDFWAERRCDISVAVRPSLVASPDGIAAPLSETTPHSNAGPSGPSEATKRAVRTAVRGIGLKPSDYTLIYRAFSAANNSQELHSKLLQNLKSVGEKVYPLIKDIHRTTVTSD